MSCRKGVFSAVGSDSYSRRGQVDVVVRRKQRSYPQLSDRNQEEFMSVYRLFGIQKTVSVTEPIRACGGVRMLSDL